MPGKVNPVICEVVIQVGDQVIGNDAAITVAGTQGQFELNVRVPLIARNLLDQIKLLGAACRLLNEKCVAGLEPNLRVAEGYAESNLQVATALNPHHRLRQGHGDRQGGRRVRAHRPRGGDREGRRRRRRSTRRSTTRRLPGRTASRRRVAGGRLRRCSRWLAVPVAAAERRAAAAGELPRGGIERLSRDTAWSASTARPQSPQLGELGIGSPQSAARRLRKQARPLQAPQPPADPARVRAARDDRAGAPRSATASTARASPTGSSAGTRRTAKRNGFLLMLDIQPGRSRFIDEAEAPEALAAKAVRLRRARPRVEHGPRRASRASGSAASTAEIGQPGDALPRAARPPPRPAAEAAWSCTSSPTRWSATRAGLRERPGRRPRAERRRLRHAGRRSAPSTAQLAPPGRGSGSTPGSSSSTGRTRT